MKIIILNQLLFWMIWAFGNMKLIMDSSIELEFIAKINQVFPFDVSELRNQNQNGHSIYTYLVIIQLFVRFLILLLGQRFY